MAISTVLSSILFSVLLLLSRAECSSNDKNPYGLSSPSLSPFPKSFGDSFFETLAFNIPLPKPSRLTRPSVEDAKYYLNFASASYCSDDSLKTFSCKNCKQAGPDWKITTIIENKLVNTRAFVAINGVKEEIVIAFRGSLNAPNFSEDFLQVDGDTAGPSDVRVHEGYYLSTKSIYKKVFTALKNLTVDNPMYEIKMVGHSLGGAQALMTLYFLKIHNDIEFSSSRMSLFTYGQPRVGNKAFADYINDLDVSYVRVVNRADIAPHYPPGSLKYFHSQNELFLNNGESRYCNNTVYEDPTCSNSYGPFYSGADHVNYFDEVVVPCVEDGSFAFSMQDKKIGLNGSETVPSNPFGMDSNILKFFNFG